MYPKNAVKALSARPAPGFSGKVCERGPATARSDQADRHGGVGSGAGNSGKRYDRCGLDQIAARNARVIL